MKDCCKNNYQQRSKNSGFKKKFNYAVNTILIVIIIVALIDQLRNN